MDTDDCILLQQWVSERDADAFLKVAMRHAKMVYRVALRILGNTHDAEEVAQECFETLASMSKPPRSNLAGWLYQVAANHAKNRIRSEQRRQHREDQYVMENGIQLLPVSDVSWDEVYRAVDEAVLALPDINREPLIAHFFEQETHEIIAQRLGVTRRTIGYRIQQGIEMVREELKKHGVPVSIVALSVWFEAQATATSVPSAQLAAQFARIGLSGAGGTALTSGPVSLLGQIGKIGKIGRMGVLKNAGWVAGGILVVALIGVAFFMNAKPPHTTELGSVIASPIKMTQKKTQPEDEFPKAVGSESAPSESPVSTSTKEDPLASLWGWWTYEYKRLDEEDSSSGKMKIYKEGKNIVFNTEENLKLSGPYQGFSIEVIGGYLSIVQIGFSGAYTPNADSFTLHADIIERTIAEHGLVIFTRMPRASAVLEDQKEEVEAIYSALEEYKQNAKGAYPERLEEVARYYKGDVALLTSSPPGREITYQPKGLTKPEVCFREDMLQWDSDVQYADQIVAAEAHLSKSGVYQYLFHPALVSIKYNEYAQRISTRGRICVECNETQFTEKEKEEQYSTCQANLTSFNLITFANNHHDYLPAGWSTLYPDYIPDVTTLSCPCRPIGDESYVILFPAVTRTGFCQDLYQKVMGEDADMDMAQNTVPMVLERGVHTIKGIPGRNVLFFDGHVELVPLRDLPQRVDRFIQANR